MEAYTTAGGEISQKTADPHKNSEFVFLPFLNG